MKASETHEDAKMIKEQRKEAFLCLEDLEQILDEEDKGENNPRAQLAWLMDLTFILKELMDLCKNDLVYRDLIFTTDLALHIQICFPVKLYRKLRKCEGEGLTLFENMVNKMEELREYAQEEVNKLDNVLYGDNTMTTMDITANSETESMAEISTNDVQKVDVCKPSKQKIEMNLKDQVTLDDSKAFKAVFVNKYEQLNDLMATTADVNSVDEPQKDFNAKLSSKKEIENNECTDYEEWEVEEHANTFEDKDGSLDDNFDVIEEADYYNEEDTEENNKAAAEDENLSYTSCIDANIYSEATSEKPHLVSEVESKAIRLLSEGSILENSDEALQTLDKVPDAEVTTKEVTQLEVHKSSQENQVENLDIIKNTLGENSKERDDKANEEVEKGDDDLDLSNISKNLKDKATIAEVTAYEVSTATMFLPRIDLNAKHIKEQVEHNPDGTVDQLKEAFDEFDKVYRQ